MNEFEMIPYDYLAIQHWIELEDEKEQMDIYDLSHYESRDELFEESTRYLDKLWMGEPISKPKPRQSSYMEVLHGLTTKSKLKEEYSVNKMEKSRDRTLSEDLKIRYNYTCQICSTRVETGVDTFYCETHHIHPRGKNGPNGNSGPDIQENMICLCSNCHDQFDAGAITINLKTKSVIHKNKFNKMNNHLVNIKHDISEEYIDYHNKYFGFDS